MGRSPCCDKNELKKGPWTPEEDLKLIHYVQAHGPGSWRTLPKNAGLRRCGKSCRLRWTNYLRPDIKRGKFSLEEEESIIQLHSTLGNKWSAIAAKLPGRTDNEIKNYWNTHIKKRLLKSGIDPVTHTPRPHRDDLLVDMFKLLLQQQFGLQAAALMNPAEANTMMRSLLSSTLMAAAAGAQNNQYSPHIHHGHDTLMLLQKILLQESLSNDRLLLFQKLLQENHALIMNVTNHRASACPAPDNMHPPRMSAAATGSLVHSDDYGYSFGAAEPQLRDNNHWSPAAFGSSSTPLSSPAADSAAFVHNGGGSTEEEKESHCCGDLMKLFEIPSGLDMEDLL